MISSIFKRKPNKPKYTIGEVEFGVESLGLIGVITTEIEFCWAIDLYAKEGVIDEINVSPKFSFNELEPAPKFKYNKSFTWSSTSAYNEEKGSWKGDFYILDAHYFEVKVELVKLSDNEFEVIVKGKVNLNFETAPTTNFVDFEINQRVLFNGVLIELEDKKVALETASKIIDIKSFSIEDKNGQYWLK